MNYPSVVMVVLNYNGGKHVLQCLESMFQITYPNYNVVLIDNASIDNSLELIKEWAEGRISPESRFFKYNPEGKPIKYIEYTRLEAEAGGGRERELGNPPFTRKLIFIRNEENFGNARGCNIGIRYSFNVLNSDFVLLLDNEVIVAPDFLDKLINIASKETDAGILGPTIYTGDTKEVWAEGGIIDYWRGKAIQKGPKLSAMAKGKDYVPMDWISTCCALVSRRMYQSAGLLDEDFSWGMEEVEYGIRATKKGFKALFVPDARVWHDQERSAEHMQRRRKLYYNVTKNQFILMWKHWGKLQFAIATFYYFAHQSSYLFRFLLYSRDWEAVRLRLRGLLDFLKERKGYRRI
jgi:hypothetical protein